MSTTFRQIRLMCRRYDSSLISTLERCPFWTGRERYSVGKRSALARRERTLQ
jgi:hypothetical protein